MQHDARPIQPLSAEPDQPTAQPRRPRARAVSIAAGAVAATAVLALWNPYHLVAPDDHPLVVMAFAAAAIAVLGVALTILTTGRRWWWRIPGFACNTATALMVTALPVLILPFALLFDDIERVQLHSDSGGIVRIVTTQYGIGPDSSCLRVDLLTGDGLFARHRESKCVHHESEIRARLIDDTHLSVMLDWSVPCTLTIDWADLTLTAGPIPSPDSSTSPDTTAGTTPAGTTTAGGDPDERCRLLAEPE